VQNPFPIVQILLKKGSIEAVCMASGGNVTGGSSFTEHLQNGISRDQVNQQEDDRDHQPKDR
jgi:hypothetical protein